MNSRLLTPFVAQNRLSLTSGAIPLRFVFLAFWLLSVTMVARTLWMTETALLNPNANVVVGKIKEAKGLVYVRPAGSIVWYDSFPDQDLYCGDTVATAIDASAVVQLGESQTMALAEGSMVIIDAEMTQAVNGLIDQRKALVLKGKVDSSVTQDPKSRGHAGVNSPASVLGLASAPAKPLKIEAKGETFNLKDGTKLGVVVIPEHAKPLLSQVSGNISTTKDHKTEVLAQGGERLRQDLNLLNAQATLTGGSDKPKLSRGLLGNFRTSVNDRKIEANKNLEKAADGQSAQLEAAKKPEPPENLKSLIPHITSPKERFLWYVGKEALASLPAVPFDIEVSIPKDAPAEWTPYIELVSKFGDKAVKVTGVPNKAKQTLQVSAAAIAPLLSQSTPKVSVQVRSGIISNRTRKFERSTFQTSVQFGDVAGFGSAPVSVQMQKFGWKDEEKDGWLVANAPDILAHEIVLKDGRMLRKILPMLRSAQAFDIQKGGLDRGKGVHFMIGADFIASVYSGKITPQASRKLGKILSADYAFRGKKTDMIDLPPSKRNRIGVVEASAKRYGQVYVISRQRIIALNADLFKEKTGIVSSIAYNISAAFKDEINLEYDGH